MNIEKEEVLRYLGYKGQQADAAVMRNIDECIVELQKHAVPRSEQKLFDVTFHGQDKVAIGEIIIKSKDLAQHISGCKQAVLFATTIGAPTDILLQRWSKLDMSRAVILQACAAALIEAYCDEQEEQISAEAAKSGLFLRPRYSPGYGDFDVEHQRDILAVLNCGKRIGLTTTDSFMLVPTKSVTAVIGLTAEKTSCHIHKCMDCTALSCPFRKG
jgi:cobalamin-dependent methionine synthase I